MAEPEFVTLQVEDGVGTIRLDRPKMNAISEQLHREVRAAALEASERDDVRAKIDAALSGATDVLWITDKRGRDVGVPSAKIAYVEVGTADGDRRIGFGG